MHKKPAIDTHYLLFNVTAVTSEFCSECLGEFEQAYAGRRRRLLQNLLDKVWSSLTSDALACLAVLVLLCFCQMASAILFMPTVNPVCSRLPSALGKRCPKSLLPWPSLPIPVLLAFSYSSCSASLTYLWWRSGVRL